jgi:hypothetical protein
MPDDKTCNRCEVAEAIHRLDGTWRGEYEGQKAALCSPCLGEALKEALMAVDNRCLLVEPASKSNAYYAYTYSDKDMEMVAGRDSSAQDVEDTRNALMSVLEEVGGTCDNCGADQAKFMSLAAPAFNDDWSQFSINELAGSEFDFSVQCGACASDGIIEAIVSKNLRLREIWMPYDGTVLMLSGEH